MAGVVDKLEEIYRRIPEIDCQRKCAPTCSFIRMSEAEAKRLGYLMGYKADFEQVPCPALSLLGSCTVYEARPAICRLYGVTEGLPCRYGCIPKKVLSRSEARRILLELMAL